MLILVCALWRAVTQTKLQPLKRSQAFIFSFMWNAGFLFSASAAVRDWSVVRCSLFSPSSSGTRIALKGWSKFATVRGDSLADLLQKFSHPCMQTHVPKTMIMHMDLHRYGVSVKSWIMTVVLQLNIRITETWERCCDLQGLSVFIY